MVISNVDRSIPVPAARVGRRVCASHPSQPLSNSLSAGAGSAGAGRQIISLATAPRGGHRLSLASLVIHGSLLDPYEFFGFQPNTPFLDRAQSISVHEILYKLRLVLKPNMLSLFAETAGPNDYQEYMARPPASKH